jgi:hypothetical protein
MLDHDNLSPDKHLKPETKWKSVKKKPFFLFVFKDTVTDLTIQCSAALGDGATWGTTVVTYFIKNASVKERKH